MKRAMKVLIFAALFVFLYSALDGLLETKTTDGIGRMTTYKALPDDTVDVLMIGSSHIGMNVDTRLLWNEYGIAGYTLWSGMQPIVDSYYFLQEALKTQSPKVVVVETFLSAFETDDYDYSTVMKSVQALPFGWDKLRAALDSAATWQQAVEMFWGMPVYHERYAELTEEDFTYAQQKKKLSLTEINEEVMSMGLQTYPVKMLDYSSITETLPMTNQNESYLRKIATLCKTKNIKLLFLVSPYEATREEAMHLNDVRRIADEYDVGYLNYLTNFAETGLDASTDFYDVGHLNKNGIQKFSGALASYLNKNYALPDRRTDETHIWNQKDTESENAPLYLMNEQFWGDGVGRALDTGVKLYENMYGSYTLLTRLDSRTFGDDEVYLSCFSEVAEAGNYGLLLRKKTEGRLTLKLGNNVDVEIPYDAETLEIAIVKESQRYTVFVNGEKVVDDYELPCGNYDGTLLVGCQELSAQGEKFRYSRTHVLNLEVYDSALSDAMIMAWQPADLPEMPPVLGQTDGPAELVWKLQERFTADAEKYVQPRYYDTGIKLYEESSTRFTLEAEVTSGMTDTGNVYFSCFAEDVENYRGIMLRQTEKNFLDLLLGTAYTLKIPCTDGEEVRIAILKDVSAYTVYVNGSKFGETLDLPCANYDGTLLIGCQRDENGELFRFSHSAVNAFEVYSGIPEEKDISAFDATLTPLPEERVATEVAYEMEHAFKGDGTNRYLDTGVLLYDAPWKDWTIDTVIEVSTTENIGVYMSCFSEEQGAYRGFMIRQSELDSLTVFVGDGSSFNVPLTAFEKKLHLVITKEGTHYLICVNGKMLDTLESRCDPYNGTLLLGAQIDADGNLFRFSSAAVDSLKLTDGAVSEAEAVERSILQESNSRF